MRILTFLTFAALAPGLAGCGQSTNDLASIRARAERAAPHKIECVYRAAETPTTTIVAGGAAAATNVRAAFDRKDRVTVVVGRASDGREYKRQVLEDVRRTKPPLDEKVAISISVTPPIASHDNVLPAGRRTPLCGQVTVAISAVAPLPRAYSDWIASLRQRLPSQVRIKSTVFNG